MTTYRLNGVVIDSEGKQTAVNEFTTSARRNNCNREFFLSNGFKGSLVQILTELNGTKTQETIHLESSVHTPSLGGG